MYKILSLVLLLVAIFGSAFANVEAVSTIQLHMYGASSVWWVAVQPRNDNGLTSKVEVKDSASSSFTTLIANKDWGYWSVSASGSAFVAPLSFRLTSSSGATITVQVNSIIADQLIDSGATFSGSASTPVTTTKPTTAPPAAAATTRPTSAPVTSAPVTSAPTTKPTTAPVSTNLCAVTSVKSEPLKVMVPLYVYPGAAWDALIAAASKVKIVAIINPNSGPLATVDSAYSTYMTKLKNAGVEMVGYVYTSYGTRDVNAVKADIDTYASKYPLVTGIFLDEAANDASKIPFYTQVYNHIMSKSGYKHAILNPGTQPDQGYLAISTNIMAFENYASAVASTTMNIVKCATTAAQKTNYKYKFSAIAHTASASVQATYVNSLANMGFGYVYVTDGAGGCCTYNTLTTYFAQLAAAVEAYNKN